MTDRPAASNRAQIDYWNAAAGQTWAKFQDLLDVQVEPLGREALRVLAPLPGERIVDIGCGCGQTALQLAAAVGSAGRVVGIDISRPMLDVARRRVDGAACPNIELRQLDAQNDALGTGVFDAAFSRFGVMFFSDPVSAFANIAEALKPGGRLVFVCWRPLADNRWMQVPLEAVRNLLPPAAPADPLAPGPFAFADAARVRAILIEAGFAEARIDSFDTAIGGLDLDRAVKLACRIGPLGALLREHPEYLEETAFAVRPVLADYLTPNGVLMPAGVWIVHARRHRFATGAAAPR